MASLADQRTVARFTDHAHLCCNPTRLAVEARALGVAYGSTGYTTRGQADRIARFLGLGPGVRLADIGAGSGWPGVYLADVTGCTVVGTDLPVDGLRRAGDRAAADHAAERVGLIIASGKHQPMRTGSFDAAVHTDVLCCLGPKQTVLRECHRLLRPGGRLAFTTIHVADGLDARAHRRAVRAGPWHVATRRPYPEMVERAGFTDVAVHDVTGDYESTQRTWLEATEANAAALRRATTDAEFALGQRERRLTRAAIAQGLLHRSLITATRPTAWRTRDGHHPVPRSHDPSAEVGRNDSATPTLASPWPPTSTSCPAWELTPPTDSASSSPPAAGRRPPTRQRETPGHSVDPPPAGRRAR